MILLTGASGYLGQYVLQALLSRGLSVQSTSRSGEIGIACDLTHKASVQALMYHCRPDIVIHCAAHVPKTTVAYRDYWSACQSVDMIWNIVETVQCPPVIHASSLVAANPLSSQYARGKTLAESLAIWADHSKVLRLPGLFGLPRRSGVIYEAARSGVIPESFGPHPAMHVQDAAEYLVRAATMPSDGNREPFNVVYGDPRLEACYGSLGVTFEQRVAEFAADLRT